MSEARRPRRARPTREDVRTCYRLLLGREPESEEMLDRHLSQVSNFAQLRDRFIHSKEFLRRNAPLTKPVATPMPLAPDPVPVETEATPEQLARMLDRTGSFWAQIGQEAPHWSVLTQDRFRPDQIAANQAVFYATGLNEMNLLRGLLARHAIDPASLPRCVEFGCGVGRATLALAGMFRSVVGCDISQPHLDLAQREAAERGICNVGWHQASIAGPMPSAGPGGGWDVWYSRLVLQHNPPPIIAHLLRLAFAGLAPGGIAVFQVPTHNIGYSFGIAAYLAEGERPGMEMHILPQARIFALAAEAGLEVLEVREDSHSVTSNPGQWLSNLFMLRRPRDAGALAFPGPTG